MKDTRSILLIIALILISNMCFAKLTSNSMQNKRRPPQIDMCANVVCQNQGVCKQGICYCIPPFGGAYCEVKPKLR